MADEVGVIEQEKPGKIEKLELEKPGQGIDIELKVDPSFPEKEKTRLNSTLGEFKNIVEGGMIMRPVRQLKVWVFPEEQIEKMNARLNSLGYSGDLGSPKEKGKTRGMFVRLRDDNALVEAFFPFGKTTTPSTEINKMLGHELVHLIEGIKRDFAIKGRVEDLIRKPIGASERSFVMLKEMLREMGLEPVCYLNMGLKTVVESTDSKGEKYYWLVRGDFLNEIVVGWVGMLLSGSGEEKLVLRKLASIVGEGKLLFAYVSGETAEIEEIFKRKTGRSFKAFTELLDEISDVAEMGNFSKEALRASEDLEKRAIAYLEPYSKKEE